MSMKAAEARKRLKELSVPYSKELGIDVRTPSGRTRWFLAAILFAAPIRAESAIKTYKTFEKAGVVTPRRILDAGWDRLVELLDAGGYTRYDFKTADKLLEVMSNLLERYGSVDGINRGARDARDLEARLKGLGKGVGEAAVNIFLRELRHVWKKADPAVRPEATKLAKRLKISLSKNRHSAAFVRLEAGLTRLAIELRRKSMGR